VVVVGVPLSHSPQRRNKERFLMILLCIFASCFQHSSNIYVLVMRSTSHPISLLFYLFLFLNSLTRSLSFQIQSDRSIISRQIGPVKMSSFSPCELNSHPSTLPGDPSLNLVTNINLGDKKVEFMKACSKAIQKATGKPEAYIAVSVTDNGK